MTRHSPRAHEEFSGSQKAKHVGSAEKARRVSCRSNASVGPSDRRPDAVSRPPCATGSVKKKYTLPSTSLDLEDIDKNDRWEAWRSFNSGLFEVDPNIPDLTQMTAKSTAYSIGDVVAGRYSHSASLFRRDPPRSALQREERVVLLMNYEGVTPATMSDRNVEVSPQSFTVFDFNQPLRFNSQYTDYLGVTLPYSDIGYDPSRHPSFLQIEISSPVGRMLLNNLEMMFDLAPTGSVQNVTSIGKGFSGLLRGLIARDLRSESMHQRFSISREAVARRVIKENVRNPALDAAAICQMVGVSRAVLYRMFEADGGVQRAITMQRLHCARKALAQAEPKRGIIAQVGRYWGFSDQAHFSRLFREAFGFRPSDALGMNLVSLPCEKDPVKETAISETEVKPLIELYGAKNSAR